MSPARGRGISIPPFGTFRLGTSGLIALPILTAPSPNGKVSVTLALPRDATLVGITVHHQGLVLHDTMPSTWRLTNVASDTLHR